MPNLGLRAKGWGKVLEKGKRLICEASQCNLAPPEEGGPGRATSPGLPAIVPSSVSPSPTLPHLC